MFLLRVALLNAAGWLLFTPILHGGSANATPYTPVKPVAPSALTLRIAGDTRLALGWTDNSNNEEGFQIERRLSTSSVYTVVETLGPNFEVFSDTTVARDAKYFYRLRAYNNEGFSSYSNIVNGTTPPLPPSGLTAKPVSTKRIDLGWIDNANTEESFEIERRLATVETYARIATLGPNLVAFSDSGLIQNTKYFYRLRAVNAGGKSEYSSAAGVTTLPTPPQAPLQLSAAAVSSAQINLTWQDKSDNESGFKIERGSASSPQAGSASSPQAGSASSPQAGSASSPQAGTTVAYLQIAVVGANVRNFSSAGLSPLTKYFYRVRAYNLGGESAFTNEASATTLPTRPSAPGNLTATTVSNTRIDLAWQDNATNEDSFKIERRKGTAGPFTQIATAGANVKKYTDSGLAANTAYSYRVRALNLGGYSDYSNEMNATTLPNRPAAPSNLTAMAVSNVQIDLAWQDNATNEDSFKIERGSQSSPPAVKYVKIATVAANIKIFSDKGLTEKTEYFYRVRAANTGGESDYSNEANAKTLPNPPGAPNHLVVTTISNSRLKLAWQDNATNEEGFQIQRKKGAAGAYVQIAIAGANLEQFADSSLASNTLYFYRLRAFNTGNHTDYSNEASAATLPDKPSAPGNLAATTVSNTQIKLMWQDNATNEDSFKIERGSAGSPVKYVKIATLGANAKEFLDGSLAANTEYFYRLRAANRGGYSDYSNAARAKTFPNPPAAPGEVTATTVSYNRIKLTWKDNANNEVGFKIERGSTGSPPAGLPETFVEIGQVGANAVSFADSGLAGNTKYYYRVRAFNDGGHSGYTNEAHATTLPNPPAASTNLKANMIGANLVNLTWQDHATNEAGFKIERKSGAAGSYEEIIAVGANITQYANTGLTEKTSYLYRVRAYNAGGYSNYSNVLEIITPPISPEVPGNLVAATVSNTQINLTWRDKSANEDGFEIERKVGGPAGSPAGVYEALAKVGANVTSYADKSLGVNTAYFYRVRAFNKGGHSDYSNEASNTTLPNPPAAPINLAAVTASRKQINLTWQDKANNEESFEIERGSTGSPAGSTGSPAGSTGSPAGSTGSPAGSASSPLVEAAVIYSIVGSVGANVKSFADTSLSPNTTYFYRVRASNRGGFSSYSNEVRAVTLPLAPAAPRKLIATTVSTTRINLAWVDSANNEVVFEIERRLSPAAAYTKIATVAANTTSYLDTSLTVNTAYFYRVRALNTGGFSSYSNEADATTLPNLPGAPSLLKATTVSNKQIDLKWQDNSTTEASFKIERGSAGSPQGSISLPMAYKEIAVLQANTKSFTDTTLAANTPYFYRVRAYNRGGHSDYSNETSATTLPNRPGAPTNLTATTASSKRIDLAWQDVANNEEGFKIERGSASSPLAGSPQAYVEVAKVGRNVTSYADNSVSANTTFFYRVRAYNAGGHSDYTNEANATTLPNVPGTPTQLTATTVSNKRIDVTWQDNATNEDSFKLERSSASSLQAGLPPGSYKQIALLRANTKSFADTALTPNTMYSYRVRAFNRGGHSGYSNEATAVTLPNRPSAPSNLTATAVSNTEIDLKWQDNSANEDSFKIERHSTSSPSGSTSSPQAYVEVAKVGPDVTRYSDNTLVANTTFFYRVRAYNRSGHSSYTNEADATTLPNVPGAPTELTATTLNNKEIDLAWQDNSTDEDSFKVERRSTGSLAGVYKQITALRANTKRFVDTTLAPSTSYFYRVRAVNRGGHSNYSNEANAMTLPNPPAPPGNLTATAVSNTQINLIWQDKASNEAGFLVERSTTSSLPVYVEVTRVGPNVTSYSDNTLTGLTTYFYRVRAFNVGGNSASSNGAAATTLPNPPENPGLLSAIAVSNKVIDLIWQDNAVDEDSFKVERRVGTAGQYKPIAALAANATKYSDTGLTPNTLYFYRVRAFNRGGYSAYSNEANTSTRPNPPAPPARLKATAIGQNQINLAWTDSAGFKVGFRIERKILDGIYAPIDTVKASVTSYQDTGLRQDTQYFYRVRAYNVGGQSGFSNEANAKTLPTPPVAPVNLTAVAINSSQVNLAWADSSNNETGFKIERRTQQTNFVEIAVTGANVGSYSNLDLAAITRYFYRIRAYNRGNHSAYSNVAEIITPPKPPTAPRDLVALTRINLQIDLEWVDTASSEDSFKIERKIGKTGAYALAATVGKDVVNYSEVNLQPVTQYFYRVRAVNSGGPSAYSNETGATTLNRPPAAPKNLTAIALNNTQIRLAWADSSNNENGFQIERKTNTTGVYVTLATIDANAKSLVDSSLSGNIEYFYRLRAYNTGGYSGYSNEASAKTPVDPPRKPTNLTATPESMTKIKIVWLDNAVNEAGFQIERKNDAAGIYAQIATVGANKISFVDSNLVVDSSYFYRVRAFNASGNSSYTNEAGTKTLPNVPAAPSNLAATVANAHRVNLAWADNSNNETGFQVERKTGTAGVYGEIGVVTANVKRFADSSLAGKTTYFYRVRTYNAGGESAYSNEAGATTLPNVPLPPTNLTIMAVSNRQIKLIWTDNSINESNFRIERRATLAGTFTVIAAVNANVTTFADTGLAALTPYYYRVYAFNVGGNSIYSNQVSATTLPNPPAKPDSLVATAINHLQINLKWKDLSDNESGFQIERKIGAGGKFVQIASVGTGVTNYFDSNLAGNKDYFYRVRAFNAGGLSNYSNEIKSTPLPIPPGSLTGGSLSNRRLYIVWTDSSNNESGFRIERRLFETEFTEIDFVGTNVRSYADSNLTPNTVYYYRVRAFNFGGLSGYSNEAAVATLPNAPSRPRGLTVKRLPNLRLALTWTDSSNNEIGFAIERRLTADTAFTEAAIVNADIATFVDTGLVAETRYFYRVRGFNTGGYSLYSNEANNVTLNAPPSTPAELSATSGGSTKINLLWADYSNNEDGFQIERKLLSDSVYAEIASVDANVISYSDLEVTKDTAYMYRVRAFNDGGSSNYTNEAGATPSNDLNLAVGKPVLASSADLDATEDRAIDGDLATYWRSGAVTATTPQAWLWVELSPTSQIVIDRVVIRWYQNFFAPLFEIQASDNGTHWTTVYATEAGKAGQQEINFASTPARFVRLYMMRNNKANYRVVEFEVYSGLAKAARATNEAIIPETVTLQPNYPNPFSANGTFGNPSTTISYALPKNMPVTLKVLNVAGQEVATLVDRRQERGIYHVTFNARKLPSGVYFAVLQAGEVRQVRQMLLAK